LESDPYERLVSVRRRLRDRITETRDDLDSWIEAHSDRRPTMTELAHLGGILAERRSLLDQMLKAEDDLLAHLVAMRRNRPEEPPANG
jgi:hypothetical protein